MVVVSVVLPVRDACPRLFSRALRATLRSRGVDLDVVVVDHGSENAVSDERATVVRVARDVSFADALNAGVAVARGDLIARMDADDVMHPDRLRLQASALIADETLSVVSSRIKVIPKTTTMMKGYALWQNAVLSPDDHRRERFIEQPLCHPAAMFRRRALDDVGGYSNGPFPEDYALFLSMLGKGHRFMKLPQVHHAWRQHAQQSTRRIDRDVIASLKATHLIADYRLADRAVVIVGAGKEGRRISRALRGHGVRVSAFVDVDVKKQGRRIHEVMVQEPAWIARRPSGAFVVGAVGTSGARGAVRAVLKDAGVVEDNDGVIVA